MNNNRTEAIKYTDKENTRTMKFMNFCPRLTMGEIK